MTLIYKIDDIPNYPYFWIRDDDSIYITDKISGLIEKVISIDNLDVAWHEECANNEVFNDFYRKGYVYPDKDPDTAQNIKELKNYCSDNTRHRKGDTGYLLDFIMDDKCNKTESKIFLHLCKNVIVWNYAITTMDELKSVAELKSDKQLKSVWKSMQEKGLLQVVNTEFEANGTYCMLVKVHPKLYWEGRYSAWLVKCKADYEYEDPISIC